MEIRTSTILEMVEQKGKGVSVFSLEGSLNRIYGKLYTMPFPGDFIIIKSESGKTALYKIIDVYPNSKNSDQYFGKVKFLGYIEDIQEALIEFAKKTVELFTPVFEAIGKFANDPDVQRALIEMEKEKAAVPLN